MGHQLGNAILSHHVPDIDDGLSFVVGIADVIGQILYPFPRDSAYPLAKALEEEDWETARPFLPEGFLEQSLMSATELATRYSKVLKPRFIKRDIIVDCVNYTVRLNNG